MSTPFGKTLSHSTSWKWRRLSGRLLKSGPEVGGKTGPHCPRCRHIMPTLAALVLLLSAADEKPRGDRYFKITVLDEETGRGVPLVELRTIHGLKLITDSNGV